MRRGQIFTLDLLAAVVILTVIIGFVTWQLEEVNNRAPDLEFQKINMLANDWTEIALRSGVVHKQNFLDDDVNRWTNFANNMTRAFADTPYKANYHTGPTLEATINGGCDNSDNIARVHRLVYNPNAPGNNKVWGFTMRVCI